MGRQNALEKLDKGQRKRVTSAVIDSILKAAAGGTVITAGLLMPGSVIALAPLAGKYLDKLDKRQRRREAERIIDYMKRKELLKSQPRAGNGLTITDEGRERAEKAQIQDLEIDPPPKWDGKWRIVFFDIPKQYKTARDKLTRKLKGLEFYQIQRSVWIHPHPSRQVIEKIALHYEIDEYITFIKTRHIDHEAELKQKFNI